MCGDYSCRGDDDNDLKVLWRGDEEEEEEGDKRVKGTVPA